MSTSEASELFGDELAEAILSTPAGKPETVTAFGRKLYIRRMPSTERDEWEASLVQKKNKGAMDLRNLRARLVVKVLVDGNGRRVFRDDQAAALGKKDSFDLDVLFKTAQRLNAVSDDDLRELAGNSAGDQNDSTGSA